MTSIWTDQYGGVRETTLGITRSNITFVGTGKDTTTILGGFVIENLENITFKQMTVTNTSEDGSGILVVNAKVELFDVALKGCVSHALFIPFIPTSSSETTVVATRCEFANSRHGVFIVGGLTSATFNNCVFNENRMDGFIGFDRATIHLHGDATAVHSNRHDGIAAHNSCKVILHLPSHHNTSYDNGGQDQRTKAGGTITNVVPSLVD